MACTKREGQKTDNAPITGAAFDAWLAKQINHLNNQENLCQDITYQRFSELPPPRGAQPGGLVGTSSPPEASFVYLDVGAWIGSKMPEGAPGWGDDPDKNAGGGPPSTGLKRDFGIICGPVVLLCSFQGACGSLDDCPEWKNKPSATKEPLKTIYASITRLLKDLSASAGSMGKAIVRGVSVASSANALWPTNPKDLAIHVVVGDMHMPVLDAEWQALCAGDASCGEQIKNEKDRRVDRYGRVQLGPIEHLVKFLVHPNSDDQAKDNIHRVYRAVRDAAAHKEEGKKIGASSLTPTTRLGKAPRSTLLQRGW